MRDALQSEEDREYFTAIVRGGGGMGGFVVDFPMDEDGDESGEEEEEEEQDAEENVMAVEKEAEEQEDQGDGDARAAATVVTPRVLAIRLNRDPAIIRLLEVMNQMRSVVVWWS